MAGLRITGPEGGDLLEVRPQLCDGRRAAGHLRIIERTPERVVVHTRCDPGLVIEKHSHHADGVIHASVLSQKFRSNSRGRGAALARRTSEAYP